MASFEKILKLDVAQEQSYIYLKCKQYDHNSRIYKLILTNEHIPILLTGKELVTVHITRADGTYIDDVCKWENENLYLTITDAMLAVAGDASMEIKIFDGAKEILTTMTNHIKVEKSMLPYDRMVLSNEFNVLNHLIQSVLHTADYVIELEDLLQNANNRLQAFEQEFSQLSNEGRSLIEDLRDIINKAAGLDNKLEQLDNGINHMQTALDTANTAKNKATEALQILNNIIEQADNLNGIILSETPPQNQPLHSLWLVKEENGIKKVGQKISNNGTESDYYFVPFAGSELDIDGNVYIDFSGEVTTGNPDSLGSAISKESFNLLKQTVEKNTLDISQLNLDKLDKQFHTPESGNKILSTDNNGNIILTGQNLLTNELKTQYDNAASKAHTHANIETLTLLSETEEGELLYNGTPVKTSITIDHELNDSSENPVQNKVIKKYIDDNLGENFGDIAGIIDSINRVVI